MGTQGLVEWKKIMIHQWFMRKRKTHFQYFKVWRCLEKVNIPLNKKKEKFLNIYSEVSEISYNTIMESRNVSW